MTRIEFTDLVNGGLHPMHLKNGLPFGIIRGQEYYTIENNRLNVKKIPAKAPATGIFALTHDGKGNLFGASALGQTIFKYNIKTGNYENSSMVGERVGPAFIRPHTRSVIGADNNIWTGWWANYGTYGGCISRINTKTNKVDSWPSSVEKQAVNSIVAGVKYIYYTTGKNGNGLDSLDCVPSIVAVNYDGEFVKKIDYLFGTKLGNLLTIDNKLLLCLHRKTIVYDEELNEVKTINISSNMMLAYDKETALFFADSKARFVNIEKGTIYKEYDIGPGYVSAAVIVDKDNIFYSKKTKLYQLMV